MAPAKTVATKTTVKKASARKAAARTARTETSSEGGFEAAADAVDTQLERYRSMRDFSVTAEPSGEANETPLNRLPFCIQKHAASHLHYDFRLGWNGVLKSWACAKGPSYVVGDKRLAVEVEDHPIEYGGFEGIIPAGQYGGGTVMLWDQGTWAPQAGHEDVQAGLQDGQLKFTMDGTKMHGKWALIRMGGKFARGSKPNWLLIKEHDEFERGAEAPAVTETQSASVVTGRSLEEIAKSEDHVWNSKETAASQKAGTPAWYRQEDKAAGGQEHKAAGGRQMKLPDGLPKELQPTFLKPQLAQETEAPPEGDSWIHELKLDGYRMQARKEGTKVQMMTRSGLDWTDRVKHVAAEVAKLAVEQVTLDGEVVVLAENGTTNFADLQASFQEGARNPLTYFCFDLLHVNGHSTRDLPLVERKKLLGEVLAGVGGDTVQLSEHLVGNGEAMFHKACELHAEGIVSKKASSAYTAGRSSAWQKAKCLHEQEFVIGGYTLPGKGKAGGPGLGALLLGYYDEGKRLIYAGRTGTGFTQKFAATLRKRLETAETNTSPFLNPSAEAKKGAIWVRPSTVAQVRFASWTADEQVRQAAFLGLREDKPASEVRRETAAPVPKSNEGKQRGELGERREAGSPAAPLKDSKTATEVHGSKGAAAGAMAKAPVRLTHPDKILDPASRLTKQQLADFYWAVAPRMLPHIAGRALSLVRLPNGVGQSSFYQKNVTTTLPAGFESVAVPDKKTGEVHQYVALSTPEAIAAMAQMSVLEVHPWGSLAADLERPDRLVIDLDPDEALGWEVLTGAAEDVRKRLKGLGLESFLKTTGGKGLHVVVPIEADMAYPEIKQWCHGFVSLMERANPKLYLTNMSKAARPGKIYLDYLRNERGATAVAPYSPRARANVGVAVPLNWAELKLEERPDFRVGNFAEWRARLKKDPWAKMLTSSQKISPEAKRACGVR